MAGIEQLEIHSKVSSLNIDASSESVPDVSARLERIAHPHKKSINFGIVKHPGSGATGLATNPEDANSSAYEYVDGTANNGKSGLFSKRDAGTAQEQLASKGFILMKWHGKCEADKVSMGTFDVASGQGGMFGMVFDNTFSKQTSKTATFVLLTYPTGQPPQGAHNLPHLQAGSHANISKTNLAKPSSHLGAAVADSTDSLPSHDPETRKRATSTAGRSDAGSTLTTHHTGTLLKRRRKKGQGYARRYFSLDYTTCTLSYYHNRKSSALRGAIPLSLAAIAADERRREINIDSGAEVWHLKASNADEFADWANALEKASRIARGLETGQESSSDIPTVTASGPKPPNTQEEEDREWHQVETLVSRVVGTRDALRRLVKDMAAQRQAPRPPSSYLSPGETSGSPDDKEGYFPAAQAEKRSFWKKKSNSAPLATATTPGVAAASPASAAALPRERPNSGQKSQEERSTYDHCTALLTDLDSVVTEFTSLISNSKRRRVPTLGRTSTARKSLESTASNDEFFDAEAGDVENSTQVVMIDRRGNGEDSQESEADEASIHDSSSASSIEEDEDDASGPATLFPAKPKSLSPLPVDIAVERRSTIPPATCPPPSLIAFVRKNVGKDLSTISMHVSANEPTSLLQRVAEQLEYAQLLNQAVQQKTPEERLLYVTAFAISQYSVNRANERVIRKPFNPLLGETYELLRTESEVPGGFRLLVEKVTHRPVRLAMHADSAFWSFTQSPAPTQKFWGKSAELATDGRIRVALRLPDGSDEHYSWNLATMILHNVVMGEKYVDPTGSMTVSNDSTGARANIEFVKPKGMWGGRGEEVTANVVGPNGAQTGLGLRGTWNQSLKDARGKEIWHVGELVPQATTTYGMTRFAATLNEITEVERGRLPPTDCRLRPDQRFAEQGNLDEAEAWKTRLEEAQRVRRRALEARGEEHRPRWFVRVEEAPGGEEAWRIKGGRDGYWEERARGEWKGVEKIFEVEE
ncbi:hypothetical protein DL770_002103 [Monosporascus sp. CRB-9-2]|nr:hypothetical protein DL770_002103 [Monosporascus sp. CRB-9-2]